MPNEQAKKFFNRHKILLILIWYVTNVIGQKFLFKSSINIKDYINLSSSISNSWSSVGSSSSSTTVSIYSTFAEALFLTELVISKLATKIIFCKLNNNTVLLYYAHINSVKLLQHLSQLPALHSQYIPILGNCQDWTECIY